jgi:hypothetical protein
MCLISWPLGPLVGTPRDDSKVDKSRSGAPAHAAFPIVMLSNFRVVVN